MVRRFGAAIGQTPLGYLQAVRLEAARALLEVGDMSVQLVASQVGYSDASSFSRLFRQGVGLSPGAYRRRFHLPARTSRAGSCVVTSLYRKDSAPVMFDSVALSGRL